MSNATKQNREREGCPFVIYGLICPITLEVKYVGQSTDLKQRTRDRTHSRHDEAVREWITRSAATCARTASSWSAGSTAW